MQFKITILLLIVALYGQNTDAQLCSDPIDTIYGVESNGNVVPINANNAGIGTSLTNQNDPQYPGSTSTANGIGLNIQNGTFYYFQDNRAGSQDFVSYQPSTNTYTVLANSPISGSTVKGCVSADGTGYYCIDISGNLCYYNIVNNTWASIGSNLVDQSGNNLLSTFAALGNGDMTIDGFGNLWIIAASTTQWGLYEINAPLPTSRQASITLNEMVPPTQPTPSNLAFVGISASATGRIFLCTVDDLYLLNNDLSITHINSFSTTGLVVDLTSCNYPYYILPIDWTGFTAFSPDNKSVSLRWSLEQQINNKGYNIEWSVDGKTWNGIGYQANKPGTGQMAYAFTDTRPGYGINYYRISAMDFSGNITYSKTKTVNITGISTVNIWPVPAKNFINVQIGSNNNVKGSNIRIFNYFGQRVIEYSPSADASTIDISSLAPGSYLLTIHFSNGNIVNQKFNKL